MPSRKPASEAQLSYKPENYAYTVIWSEEDQIYIGRVAEFPLLAAHGASPEAALKEITDVVRYVLEDLEESGEEIPPPLSKRHFSGKLRLRMPEQLHRTLALEAAQQHVSLNQWINLKLSR
jgi:predicted HicB family RNase H-like nuclease